MTMVRIRHLEDSSSHTLETGEVIGRLTSIAQRLERLVTEAEEVLGNAQHKGDDNADQE